MKLLTKAIEKAFAKQGRVENDSAKVIAKFFTPDANWTWYATEYYPETRTFFGLVDGLEVEMGYFSLDELLSVRGRFGLPVERDQYWTPITIGELKAKVGR